MLERKHDRAKRKFSEVIYYQFPVVLWKFTLEAACGLVIIFNHYAFPAIYSRPHKQPLHWAFLGLPRYGNLLEKPKSQLCKAERRLTQQSVCFEQNKSGILTRNHNKFKDKLNTELKIFGLVMGSRENFGNHSKFPGFHSQV